MACSCNFELSRRLYDLVSDLTVDLNFFDGIAAEARVLGRTALLRSVVCGGAIRDFDDGDFGKVSDLPAAVKIGFLSVFWCTDIPGNCPDRLSV